MIEVLDEVDRGVLHLLQQDARNLTAKAMAEQLPVTGGTVRNRIDDLEARGVISGYVPLLDYAEAGLPLQMRFTCSAPIDERADLAQRAQDIDKVVSVRGLLAAHGNVEVVAVAAELDEFVTVAVGLVELGLTIDRQRLLLEEFHRPFNHLGTDDVESSG